MTLPRDSPQHKIPQSGQTSLPARKPPVHGTEETFVLGAVFVQIKISCKIINFSYYLSRQSVTPRNITSNTRQRNVQQNPR